MILPIYQHIVQENRELRAEVERLREALEYIEAWSRAYRWTVFPKPDYQHARKVLEAAGMTLDSISADCMRHVVETVAKEARRVLQDGTKREPGVANSGSGSGKIENS